jgi:hypothetical protein
MTQTELHRAISRATGDDVEVIARRGFSLLEDEHPASEDDLAAHVVDWDQLQADRNTAVLTRRGLAAVA